MRLCLDTSAYSHFRRGHAPAVDHVGSATWVGVPTIVLGKLEVGYRLGRRAARNLDELGRFLQHPVVELVGVDRDVARLYAEMVVGLRRRGTPVPTNDVWVAACTARVGATLVTYDRHFELVDRVGVLVLDSG